MDDSRTMAWLLREETMTDHDGFGARLRTDGAIVPMHWRLEVANARSQGVHRNRIDRPDVQLFLSALEVLPIIIDRQAMIRAWDAALALGLGHRLSVYDAAYFELSVRRTLPLATLDRKLARAATGDAGPKVGAGRVGRGR